MPLTQTLTEEISVSTGAGNLTLVGLSSRRRFSDAHGTGASNLFTYMITHASTSADEWEEGIGYMLDADTLVRDTVTDSSNAGALVNFSGGTKHVVNDIPGDKIVSKDETDPLTQYARKSQNLADLTDASAARTNIGLTAGGAGDIWLEKAGDTATGEMEFADLAGAIKSGAYALQLQSGVLDGAAAEGFVFDTINDLVTNGSKAYSFRSAGVEHAYIARENSKWGVWVDRLAVGDAVVDTYSFKKSEGVMTVDSGFPDGAGFSEDDVTLDYQFAVKRAAAYRGIARVTGPAVLPFASGLLYEVDQGGTGSWGANPGVWGQEPTVLASRYTSQPGSVSLGNWVNNITAGTPDFGGGVPAGTYNQFAANAFDGATAGTPNVYGQYVAAQTGTTEGAGILIDPCSHAGLILNATGAAGQILFGPADQASMQHDATDFVYNTDVGAHKFTGGDVIVPSDANKVGIGTATPTAGLELRTNGGGLFVGNSPAAMVLAVDNNSAWNLVYGNASLAEANWMANYLDNTGHLYFGDATVYEALQIRNSLGTTANSAVGIHGDSGNRLAQRDLDIFPAADNDFAILNLTGHRASTAVTDEKVGELNFNLVSVIGPDYSTGKIESYVDTTGGNGGYFVFKTGDGGNTEILRLLKNNGDAIFAGQIFHGDVTKELVFQPGSLGKPATDPMSQGIIGTFAVSLADDTTEENAFLTVHVPADYKAGTDMTLHLHYINAQAQTGTKSTVWGIEYKPVVEGETATGGTTTVEQTHTLPADVAAEVFHEVAAMTITGLAPGDKIGIRVYRKAGDVADDAVGDMGLDGVHIEYTSDQIGG